MEYHSDIEFEWEDLMAGGPASINYMSAVMAVASRKDFPLKADVDYKLVKYPNSFHATLVQVANDMYRALYGAHTSMDKIQANMRQIPSLIKTALKLVTQASSSMTKSMLPRTLASIGRYANDSATVARASLERFDHLQALLQEIVEVSTLTNSDNRQIVENLAAEAEKLRENKNNMDKAIAEIKAKYETAQQSLEKSRQDYHTAMLNVPGGEWNSHAWNVYASHRPAETCTRKWFRKRCTSNREQQFADYTREARQKAQEVLVYIY
jgi:polyhydroxyalkanoate synthesis regulator phasin